MIDLKNVYQNQDVKRYGFLGNVHYNMRHVWEWDKKLYASLFLIVFPSVAVSYFGTLLPARVVSGLEETTGMQSFVLNILLIAGVILIGSLIVGGLQEYINWGTRSFPFLYLRKYVHRMVDIDYEFLEEEAFQKVEGNTRKVTSGWGGITMAVISLPQFLIGLGGVLFYGYLLGRKSIILLVLIVVSMGVSLWMLAVARKKHGQYFERLSQLSRKQAYITRQTIEANAGKDIRIYHMMDWFLNKYDESMEEMDHTFRCIHDWYFLRGLSDAFAAFLRDGFAYIFLLWLLTQGDMKPSEFVFYIGLVSGFATYFETMIRQALNFNTMSVSISFVRRFFEFKDRWNRTEGLDQKTYDRMKAAPVKLTLKDVSFTYPGKEEPTLSHINVTIAPGEKLALIGLNGAGKTTLVKLICGFYHPSEGQILLNDIPIEKFEREQYYGLVSVLFQDTTILPVSVDENLTGQDKDSIDREHLNWALQKAGFLERYRRLPKAGEDMLVREIYKDGVDFSGGEKQKMLFTRALYKKTPLIILDEPTAALDPIAENELYQNYSDAMKGKTSIYISHRLSSTRFCDRILLLEQGRIIEEGTHESLLAKGERYAQLYQIQSQYYQEQQKKKEMTQAMGDAVAGSDDEMMEGGQLYE